MNLVLKEVIFQASSRTRSSSTRSTGFCTRRVEERSVLDNRIENLFDLINIVCSSESEGSFGVESTERGEEVGSLFFREGSAEGVDRDVEGSSIGFEGENG